MIRSMTAFARQESETRWGALAWELRTVNHRYLEVTVRMPDELRALEVQVRERAAKQLRRGKLDCSLRLRLNVNRRDELKLDEPLLQQVLDTTQQLTSRLSNPAPISPLQLMQWPGVVLEEQLDMEPIRAAALDSFDRALQELRESREREGGQLAQLLVDRLDAMEPLVVAARKRLPEVRERIREKLKSRVEELVSQPDQDRLEQELVFMAQKMDVDEELDRLDGHMVEARRVLKLKEPVGRRLDFLMQEFNREANTLASKSADSETTQIAVELKVLIEQMREQVQNIE